MIPVRCPVTDDSLHKIISSGYKHDNKFGHIAKNVTVTALIVSVLSVLLMTVFSTTFPVQVQSSSEFDSYTVGSSEL